MSQLYKPRTRTVIAFQYTYGVKHPVLREQPYSEPEGGPPLGGGVEVVVGPRGQTRTLQPGDYVIIHATGICEVLSAAVFEAIYEPVESR